MRNILISIRPEFVSKILNGEKTIEIRKTRPSCELPCKVYIYCTKNNGKWIGQYPFYKLCDKKLNDLNGKVVAEFTLNVVEDFECASDDFRYLVENTKCCLTMEEVLDYCKGQNLYGWYIDDLKIYDKPKELSQFRKDLDCDDYPCNKGKYCEHDYYDYCEGCKGCAIDFDGTHCIYKQIKRPPQSYMFVEGE